ncbi:HNH endonuclease [Henriciella aquimarina]|uniref:HNH endonuclease n=1 Tax=Henriciella aquimarina TaxID=545261 RepID=UPI0038993869
MRNHNHDGQCSVRDCQRPHLAKGFCSSHYARVQRSGSPSPRRPFKTNQKKHLAFLGQALDSDTDECIEWPFRLTKQGYARISLFGKPVFVSRAVCAQAHGAPPSQNWHAAHSCGNPCCINPKHLSWKTAAGNMADKIEHGTHQIGEANPHAKLTEDQVLEMRRLRPSHSLSQLAAIFDVTPTTVSGIVRRKSWTHI